MDTPAGKIESGRAPHPPEQTRKGCRTSVRLFIFQSLRQLSNLGPCGRQLHLDQSIYLRPDTRIAFDSCVALEKEPIMPWIATALGRFGRISVSKVSKDSSAGRIQGPDPGSTAQYSLSLIEVDSFAHVRRNHRIVLAVFSDAVHLHGQGNGYSIPLKIARKINCGRCSPAMTEKNDSGLLALLAREVAVIVSVESSQHETMRLFYLAIVKYLGTHSAAVSCSQSLYELYFRVAKVITVNKASHKTYDDSTHRVLMHFVKR